MVKFSRSTGILLTVGVTFLLTDLMVSEAEATAGLMQRFPNPLQKGPQAPSGQQAPQMISPQMVSSAVQGANQGQAGPATLNPAQQGILNQSLKQPTPAPGAGPLAQKRPFGTTGPGQGNTLSGGAALGATAGGGAAISTTVILNKTCFSALHCNDIDDFKGKCLKKQKKLEEGQEDHDEATYKSIAASVLKNTKKFKRCVAKAKKEAEKEKKKGDSTFYDFLASAGYFPDAAAAGANGANAAGTPGAAGANGTAGQRVLWLQQEGFSMPMAIQPLQI